jgi:hypothetical protein
VQRHDRHAGAGARVGLRVQPGQRIDERRPIGHVAGDLELGDEGQETLDGIEIDRLGQRGTPAECEPRPAYPLRNACASVRSECGREHRRDTGEACATVGREARNRLRRVHQGGDRAEASGIGCGDNGEQVRQEEPAPGRAQNGEPSQSIGRLNERMRQRHEILHRDPLAQGVELNRGKWNAGGTQRRQHRFEMRARAHQHGYVVRAFGERRRDVSDYGLRFVLRIAQDFERDRLPGAASRTAAAGRSRRRRARIAAHAKHARKTSFVHSTRRACDRKLRAARCCRPATRRCAPFPGLQRTIGLRRRGTDRSTASDRRRRTASAHRPAPNPP